LVTGPEKPGGDEGAGVDDTLPATSGLGTHEGGDEAPTVVTPRSHRPGSDVTALSDVGHAETVSGDTPHSQSPGRGADQVLVAVGTLLGKRYRIGEHLGSGGMGTVYAAHDLLVDQAVALKFVRPSLASDHRERERLRHEVRLAQSVTHVNVARTYTLDEMDNHLFIVMELLRGPTLSARLREGPLALDEALRIARDLLHGLAAAHGRGILHRDIKPGNVKLVDDGRAVIMDFGMARASESTAPSRDAAIEFEKLKVQITHTMLGGTPGYIAPEILRGRRGDARADLYSFGVMLFEMLAGRAPFAWSTPQELLLKHLVEEPATVNSLRAEIPPYIAALVARLLAKNPDDRPFSADAVRRDLGGPEALARGTTNGGARAATPLPAASATSAASSPSESAVSTARGLVVGAPRRARLWWVAAGVLVGGGITFAIAAGTKGSRARATDAAPAPVLAAPALPDAAASAVAPAAVVPDAAPVAATPPRVDAGAAPAAPSVPARSTRSRRSTASPPPSKSREAKPNPDDPAAEKRRRQLELED
jgi:tRNA A-37 threonylcarbamoyl transferase component Bud32